MDSAQAAGVNAAYWDGLAARHAAGTGRFYDLERLVRGEDPLWEAERAALALVAPDGVAGMAVMHLQCHLGGDAVHLARQGALVTGLDVSAEALRIAAERARLCDVQVEWVCADAVDPPVRLAGRFELVWATIGVTCWAVDLARWFQAAAGMLAPGGRLALVEIHPAYTMLDALDPMFAGVPYGGGAITREQSDSSYDDPAARFDAVESVSTAWGIGDHVTAALAAGLRVDVLTESDSCEHDPRGLLDPDPDGRFRVHVGPDGGALPILFTLVATR